MKRAISVEMLTYLHPETVDRFLKVNGISDLRPSLDLLSTIGSSFQKIPYENMTKLIRAKSFEDPRLRLRLPELLYEEHLRFGTGGTCFSMTYFMQTILRSLGFNTHPVMADRPLAPNTHCATVTNIDGIEYLLDPGFLITTPLPITREQKLHRLRHNNIIIGPTTDGVCIIATEMGGKTTVRYFMKMNPVSAAEFLKHWENSFDWPTLRNISITTATESGFIYARNNFIRTTESGHKTQTRIKSGLDLEFEKTFNIDRKIIKTAFEVLREIASSLHSSQ